MTMHSPNTRQRALEALRRLRDRESTKRVMEIVTDKVVPPPPGSTEWQFDMDDTRAEATVYADVVGRIWSQYCAHRNKS